MTKHLLNTHNILTFDTSSPACSVALLSRQKIFEQHKIAPRQHAQLILPMISTVLDEAKLHLNDIDQIAYGQGPGSFTGVRIARSVAQSLAFITRKPTFAISSLAAMAQTLYLEKGWEQIFVAVESGMKKINWAIYYLPSDFNQNQLQIDQGQEKNNKRENKLTLFGQEQECQPEALDLTDFKLSMQQKKWANKPWYGIGDAFKKYAEVIEYHLGMELQDISTDQLPSAYAILRLI